MIRSSVFRLSPLLVLAVALAAMAVLLVHDTRPASADHEHTTTVWDTLLTQSSDTSYLGCNNSTSGMECTSYLREDEFTYDGVTYAIVQVGVGNSVASIVFDKAVPTSWRSEAELWLHNTPFTFENATVSNSGKTFAWGDFGTTWGSGNTVRVRLDAPTPPIWSATLTVQDLSGVGADPGCSDLVASAQSDPNLACSTAAALTDDDFIYDGESYEIKQITISSGELTFELDKTFPPGLALTVAGRTFLLRDARLTVGDQPRANASWSSTGLSAWSVGATVSLSLSGPALPYGAVLSTDELDVTEGGTGAFTVALAKDPGADKTVHLVKTQYFGQYGDSSAVWDQNAVTLDVETLTFTAGSSGNWATAQTVTVTAPEDDDSCHEQLVVLVLEGTSGDYTPVGGSYNSATGVYVTVTDDDGGACGGI